jgi:cytochrome bd-type quinol oxidase subunit 1
MTRSEAGNLLMVGAGIISALHVGLFSVWVTAIVGDKCKVAFTIAIFGTVLIVLNTVFWFIARQKFQQEIKEKFSWLISLGLIFPFIMIFFGWLFCIYYLN